jgi:hypothetical protein
MVARRRRDSSDDDPLADFQPTVRAFPRDDEDPALFWGPDWKEKLDEALADVEAGRITRFESEEEFFAALERLESGDADV